MTIGFGQMMYTPNDKTRSDLIKDDRPFAGALMLSLGYNARRGDTLRTSQLRVGVVVGPPPRPGKSRTGGMTPSGGQIQWLETSTARRTRAALLHERRTRVIRQRKRQRLGLGSDPPLGRQRAISPPTRMSAENCAMATPAGRFRHGTAAPGWKTPRPCVRPLAATGTGTCSWRSTVAGF